MTPDEVIGQLSAPLSLRRRLAYVVVALLGLVGAGLIAVLWATERGLPARTQAAFGVLVVIGLGWASFGAWAVSRRTPLFARDRVVAGWLGMAAWAVFAVGALVVAPSVPVGLVVVVGALGAVGLVNLGVALRARSALLRRKAELGG
jgi:hypothetical protein